MATSLQDPYVLGFSDAAWGSRPDGYSEGGFVVGLSLSDRLLMNRNHHYFCSIGASHQQPKFAQFGGSDCQCFHELDAIMAEANDACDT